MHALHLTRIHKIIRTRTIIKSTLLHGISSKEGDRNRAPNRVLGRNPDERSFRKRRRPSTGPTTAESHWISQLLVDLLEVESIWTNTDFHSLRVENLHLVRWVRLPNIRYSSRECLRRPQTHRKRRVVQFSWCTLLVTGALGGTSSDGVKLGIIVAQST